MHVDTDALRIAIRDTLGLFLRDHDGLEHAEVQIEEPECPDEACRITVDGCVFSLVLQ